MKNYMKMLMEEKKESDGGGGENPPAKKFPTPPPAKTPDDAPNDDSKEDKEVDQYGYEVDPKKDDSSEKPADKKANPPKKEDEGKSDISTGYDDEPPADSEKEEEQASKEKEEAKEKKPDTDKSDDEFEVKDPGELLDDEIAEIKDFVKKNKVPKEIAQALVEAKKQEVKKLKEQLDNRKKEAQKLVDKTKRDWHNELKNDPTFGGEKFAYNVKKAEKVIAEFMPNVKKMLTDRKTMLPPYVMRDLVTLADHLYDSETLVHGDPIKEKPSEKEDNNPLAFYE